MGIPIRGIECAKSIKITVFDLFKRGYPVFIEDCNSILAFFVEGGNKDERGDYISVEYLTFARIDIIETDHITIASDIVIGHFCREFAQQGWVVRVRTRRMKQEAEVFIPYRQAKKVARLVEK
jgi:hypothetical protein